MAELRPLKSKKTQSRIQEMIFMILAIAVFFILVLLFYLAVSLGNIKRTAEAGTRSGAILLIAGLAGSPEFNCPESSGICVDTDKLLVLSNYSEYSRFWNVAGLRVERVYPILEKNIICNKFNYPRCNIYLIVPSKSQNVVRDESYVSLCRIEYKNEHRYTQCDLGKIIVETEKKT
jgi:hypothetical protein